MNAQKSSQARASKELDGLESQRLSEQQQQGIKEDLALTRTLLSKEPSLPSTTA
jgi:hypothetical protein